LKISFLLMLSGFLHSQEPYTGRQCIVKSGFIYQAEDVNFPACHASTVIHTPGGLVAAWFGGTAEGNPDVCIWTSINTGGGWSKPVETANGIQHKGKRYPCWNPVLYREADTLLLFYKAGPSPSAWWGELIYSVDNGRSWSFPRRLPEDILGPVKNKPVLLKTGELLCPSSSENDGWRVHMEFTSDLGFTWERTRPLNAKEIFAIQPSVLFHPGDRLQLVCRSKGSQILTAWSYDNGRHWTGLMPFGLPNPDSGIDAVTLKDGRHIMIYNHLTTGRNTLNAAVSDDGNNWLAAVLLENDHEKSEYSYPAVIQADDGMVHITYTWNRKLIKHVVIDPDKIITRSMKNGSWPEN